METGKEIYKEYLCKWVDAENLNDMAKLNESYFLRELDFRSILKRRGKENVDLLDLYDDTYDGIRRAPKTQMINGHEVIAPMHDTPDSDQIIYWLDFSKAKGYTEDMPRIIHKTNLDAIIANGWFDNEKDVIAYAKAHRESK